MFAPRIRPLKVLALAGALCLALFLLGAGPGATASASASGEAAQLGQGWCDAWNSHDATRLPALFAADGVYEDVPLGQTARGSAGIQAFAQSFFAAVDNLHVECTATELRGGHGSIEWVFSGTDVGIFGTGGHFAVRGTSILDVRGGKIARNADYYDFATIMRQLGLIQ